MEDNPIPMGAHWQTKADAGWTEFEYTGLHDSELVFGPAPTGRRYRAGNTAYHKFIWVHPDDVQYISRLACFERAKGKKKKPLVSSPMPVPAPRITGDGLDITTMRVADVLDHDFKGYDAGAIRRFIAAERVAKNRSTIIAALGRVLRRKERKVPA